MHIIGALAMILLPTMFMDWHARFVFVAIGYPRKYGHGKSWKRAKKHYKTNWSLIQRLFWIPLFKEKYEDKFMAFAYLSYINLFLAVATVVGFFIWDFFYYPESPQCFGYQYGVFSAYTIIRFIYSNGVGRGKFFF